MSFLKKLMRSPDQRNKKKERQSSNKTVEELRHSESDPSELRGRPFSKQSRASSRSNSPSPAPSPVKMHALSHSAFSVTATTPTLTTVGVRSPHSKHFAQILPGLLLGSQEIAQDLHALERANVTHILNVTPEVQSCFPNRFVYKQVPIQDMPSVNIMQYLDECYDFIDNARGPNGTDGVVLVHCFYGASRSASIVIAYLIKHERMRYKEALEYLQILRPYTKPNEGFQKQLKDYEQKML